MSRSRPGVFHLGPREAPAPAMRKNVASSRISARPSPAATERSGDRAALDALESDHGLNVPDPTSTRPRALRRAVSPAQARRDSGSKAGAVDQRIRSTKTDCSRVAGRFWRDGRLAREWCYVNYRGGTCPPSRSTSSGRAARCWPYLMLNGLGRAGYTRVMREGRRGGAALSESPRWARMSALRAGASCRCSRSSCATRSTNYPCSILRQLRRPAARARVHVENLQDMSVLRIGGGGMTAGCRPAVDPLREKTEFPSR